MVCTNDGALIDSLDFCRQVRSRRLAGSTGNCIVPYKVPYKVLYKFKRTLVLPHPVNSANMISVIKR
jgi:hypothetical protein